MEELTHYHRPFSAKRFSRVFYFSYANAIAKAQRGADIETQLVSALGTALAHAPKNTLSSADKNKPSWRKFQTLNNRKTTVRDALDSAFDSAGLTIDVDVDDIGESEIYCVDVDDVHIAAKAAAIAAIALAPDLQALDIMEIAADRRFKHLTQEYGSASCGFVHGD